MRILYSWPAAITVFIALLVPLLWINQSTFVYLASKWNIDTAGTYSHGYLVVLISLYLLYERRQQLLLTPPRVTLAAAFPLLIMMLVNVLAVLADVQSVQAVSWLLLLLALVWFVLGQAVARQLLFPLLFIGFALPVWFPLSPYLQQLTAEASFWVIRLLNIPALIDGNIIVLPAGRLSVEQSCAGLNYLLAAMTLSTLYAWLNYSTVWSRLLVVVIAVLVAVLSNILRVIIIIVLAYQSDMQHPWVKDHLSLGWGLFAVFFMVLLVLDVVVHRSLKAAQKSVRTSHGVMQPDNMSVMQWVGVISVAVVSGVLAVTISVSAAASRQMQASALPLPDTIGGWHGIAAHDDWRPAFTGALESLRIYQKGVDRITLYAGYYPVQHQGRELINVLNHIDNPAVWRKMNTQALDYAMNSKPVLEQVLVNRRAERRRVWYWYRVAGVRTTNPMVAKFLQAAGQLSGNRDAAVIAVSLWPQSGGDARSVLQDFVLQMQQHSKLQWLQ